MALAWQNLPLELNLRQALIKLFFMDTMAMGNMTYTGIYIYIYIYRQTWVPQFASVDHVIKDILEGCKNFSI